MQGQTRRLNADGFRVIAVAYKEIAEPRSSYRNAGERDPALLGYIVFLDPPKETPGSRSQRWRARASR
jgi:Mg2+-importing ATPase